MLTKNISSRLIIGISLSLLADSVLAARLKDIANVRGVRENQLVGYGLVVGLAGTGDGGAEFTSSSMGKMLEKIGVKLENKNQESKNVAGVLITANLPAFAKAGNKIDITVNAIGGSSSLKGGTLVQSALRAANGDVYAVAQGQVLIGEGENGAHLTVGRVPGGAIIEKDVVADFSNRKLFRLTLQNPDFTTAMRVVKTINSDLGGKYASALDSTTIDVIVPAQYEGNAVEFLALIEGLEVSPDQQARVVVNEKTGTVIIGEKVSISRIAISHGNLSLRIGGGTPAKDSKDKVEGERIAIIGAKANANVEDLVSALNRLGIKPKDLITILQSIKAAGALQAEIEIL